LEEENREEQNVRGTLRPTATAGGGACVGWKDSPRRALYLPLERGRGPGWFCHSWEHSAVDKHRLCLAWCPDLFRGCFCHRLVSKLSQGLGSIRSGSPSSRGASGTRLIPAPGPRERGRRRVPRAASDPGL
ncbi:hypothetical protein H1C71_035119, partial [Ictidomys tridecemlineatus]